MKLKHIVFLAALTGIGTAAPEPGGPAAGRIPDWLDTDGDGVLSEAERQAFAESRRNASEGLHQQWDTNGDGVVDDDERQAGIDALRAKAEEKRCELFEAAAGGDGELTLEEFSALHPLTKLPDEVVEALFGMLDGDGDGVVTKDEFLDATGRSAGPPDHPGPGGGE
jgi:hypothetical protein